MNTPRLLIPMLALSMTALAASGVEPFSFPRATPESQGVSSKAILNFIREAEPKVDGLHSFMLVRHGHVVAEGWWAPYGADQPHVMFSLSKSFTSTAVGFAVAEGKLNIFTPVIDFFPGEAPVDPSQNLKSMRIRDLLTMSTGHEASAIDNFPFYAREDLVRRFLALPVSHKPGTLFVYNTPASYMLSAIVQKVTGQTVLDYLRPRLFEPLGITDATWEKSSQGINMGGFGLKIRTEDIARFGQLYLQKGMWQGRQLLPASWVEEATARQMSNGSDPTGNWDQGYGFQFWRCPHGVYRGDGAFGQFCIVMDKYDAVLAITSGTADMSAVLDSVWKYLLPAFHDAALPADPAADSHLSDALARLEVPPQVGMNSSPMEKRVLGRRYVFPENPKGITAVTLVAPRQGGTWMGGAAQSPKGTPPGAVTLLVEFGAKIVPITAAPGLWHRGGIVNTETGPEPIAASGAWTSDYTYTLKVCRYQTPFVDTYELRFSGDELRVDSTVNVSFGDRVSPTLIGTAKD